MNEWISVKDRLPEHETEVDIFIGYRITDCLFIDPVKYGDDDEKHFYDEKNAQIYDIDYATYWMPKPDPPKQERQIKRGNKMKDYKAEIEEIEKFREMIIRSLGIPPKLLRFNTGEIKMNKWEEKREEEANQIIKVHVRYIQTMRFCKRLRYAMIVIFKLKV